MVWTVREPCQLLIQNLYLTSPEARCTYSERAVSARVRAAVSELSTVVVSSQEGISVGFAFFRGRNLLSSFIATCAHEVLTDGAAP
jgi:hypothetical protein